MISKGEAILRLKKMGVTVADDQSIVTILLPKEVSLSAGIKDIKEKMKAMDYNASFCIRQKSDMVLKKDKQEYSAGNGIQESVEEIEETEVLQEEITEEITEEDLKGSLLSMDDDGQFTLGGFGMDF